MWTAYKKEIIEKEEENQEFLKLYYQNSHRKHNPDSSPNVLPADEEQHEEEENDLIASNNYDEVEDSLEQDEDDWPVQVRLSFKKFLFGVVNQGIICPSSILFTANEKNGRFILPNHLKYYRKASGRILILSTFFPIINSTLVDK